MGTEDLESKQFRQHVMSLFGSKLNERQKPEMFIPRVVLNERKDEIRVQTVKMGTSLDGKGLMHHYSVTWTEEAGGGGGGSTDNSERKRSKRTNSEQKLLEARRTGKLQCDGPCGRLVDVGEVVQFGCDHLICDKCRRSQKSEALYDGSPGCCHRDCVEMAIISGLKIRTGRQLHSASTITARSNEDPLEVLHVHVSIVTKSNGHIYRGQHTYEFPTQTRVAELNAALSQYRDIITTARVYYSLRKPRSREDLQRISLIDTNLRFYHLPGYVPMATGDLYVLVVADGVRVY